MLKLNWLKYRQKLLLFILAFGFSFVSSSSSWARYFVYVSEDNSTPGLPGQVEVFDPLINTVIATIEVGDSPTFMTVNPEGSRAYTSNFNDDTVSIIDTSTNVVIGTVNVGHAPKGIDTALNGSKTYVANTLDNTVSVIDASTQNVIKTLLVGDSPNGLVASPSGDRVYVAVTSGIAVIDTSTDNLIDTIDLGIGVCSNGVAINSVGTRLYVTESCGGNHIYVVSTETSTLETTWTIPGITILSAGIAVNPDGDRVALSGTGMIPILFVLDATQMNTTILETLGGADPLGVGFSPDGNRIYTADYDLSTLSIFDVLNNFYVEHVPLANDFDPSSIGKFIGPELCGNGIIDVWADEECDDGNSNSGDGCSFNDCVVESNWNCTGVPSVCTQNQNTPTPLPTPTPKPTPSPTATPVNDNTFLNGGGCSLSEVGINFNFAPYLILAISAFFMKKKSFRR